MLFARGHRLDGEIPCSLHAESSSQGVPEPLSLRLIAWRCVCLVTRTSNSGAHQSVYVNVYSSRSEAVTNTLVSSTNLGSTVVRHHGIADNDKAEQIPSLNRWRKTVEPELYLLAQLTTRDNVNPALHTQWGAKKIGYDIVSISDQ